VPDVDWKRPDDVIVREIDPASGMLATVYCPQTKSEIFVAGTEPTAVCSLHAGSGETNALWRDEAGTLGPQAVEADANAAGKPGAPAQPAAQQARPQDKRERGIRRLLRAILGGGR
jgi:hypothetical protein